jgi:hypothetical protein
MKGVLIMNKELHIWMGNNYPKSTKMSYTLEETEFELHSDTELINTVQTHVCSTVWLLKGYRIFVHMLDENVFEIKLDGEDINGKTIRPSQNLEKMLLSGCFGLAVKYYLDREE